MKAFASAQIVVQRKANKHMVVIIHSLEASRIGEANQAMLV